MSSKLQPPVPLDLDDDESIAEFAQSAHKTATLSQTAKLSLAEAHCRAMNRMSTGVEHWATLDRSGKVRIHVRPTAKKDDFPF